MTAPDLPLSQRLLSQTPLTRGELARLQEAATALERAAEAGIAQPLLRGKNIAVLCGEPGCACADAFAEAATRLGARIARLTPDAALRRGETGATQDTARLLGRMYDAVECDDLPAAVVQQLQRSVEVPVFNGLARPDHPWQQLLPGVADPARRLQALLVATLA